MTSIVKGREKRSRCEHPSRPESQQNWTSVQFSSKCHVNRLWVFLSSKQGQDHILLYPRNGRDHPLPGVHIAVAILLDVTVLEALSCTLGSWRGSPRVRGMDLFYPRTRGDDTTSQYLGMRLCLRHQLEWSAVQSPSSCITDKNKKIHLKNIIQQIDRHLGFSVNFKTDRGWLRSNVFNYWEIKTRLILLRSSPAVSPQLCLGCRGRWEEGAWRWVPPESCTPQAWTLQTEPAHTGGTQKSWCSCCPPPHRPSGSFSGRWGFAWWFRHSPHQRPHYRNRRRFAPSPVCSGWGQGLQAAAADANKPATAIVSTISPGASHPPPGCHFWFCSPLAHTICIRCLCRVRTEPSFLSQNFARSESKLIPFSW